MSAPRVEHLADGVTLWPGDCLAFMRAQLPNSFDSVVCDPPYHLTSGGGAKGFMGKTWDGGDIAFRAETWREVLRVLKPGGHLVAFSGSRTYHRMACAIEDAGFEIRDQLMWLYGSGFPKSLNVGKAIDKAAGAERQKVRIYARDVRNPTATGGGRDGLEGATRPCIEKAMECGFHEMDSRDAVTDDARQWQGWGTALKPAHEPICFARKPLGEATVAANVLRWGTGGINVDACRIESGIEHMRGAIKGTQNGAIIVRGVKSFISTDNPLGRWPANVLHDGSPEVLAEFPETDAGSGSIKNHAARPKSAAKGQEYAHVSAGHADDGGSAARYFYSSKAGPQDRCGSKHPTIKPVSLMQWLVRLVTPPGGRVLDPFAGSGTTGQACALEGFSAVLCEMEAEYQADIRRRMAMMAMGQVEKTAVRIEARGIADHAGPLFGNLETVGGDVWSTANSPATLNRPNWITGLSHE